jgi:hypothetical protein
VTGAVGGRPLSWALRLTLLVATAACRAGPADQAPAPAKDKPALAVLTALPIVFGEGFGLDAPANPVLSSLSQTYRVRPIDGPDELPEGGLLLAAQPRALTAERLVALDAWVRRGGRMLLLADPHLEWRSDRPMEDKFRPPVSFDDTGLLVHWGLQLTYSEMPARPRSLGRQQLVGMSPGVFTAYGKSCTVGDGGLRADCRIGRGRAIVIADADWIDPRQWADAGSSEPLKALTDQLALLEQ